MKINILFLTIIASLIFCQTGISYAKDSIRCYDDNKSSSLVFEGDSKFKLLSTCGEPLDKQIINYQTKTEYDEKITYSYRNNKYLYNNETAGSAYSTTSVVEEWFYNCGKGQFNIIITIKDGIISGVKKEGRGFGKMKCF